MESEDIQSNLIQSAKNISTPKINQDLFNSQLSYWLSIKMLMMNGGYSLVKEYHGYISLELAEKLEVTSVSEIKKLCNSFYSILRPSVKDQFILTILNSEEESVDEEQLKLLMQAMSGDCNV